MRDIKKGGRDGGRGGTEGGRERRAVLPDVSDGPHALFADFSGGVEEEVDQG